MPNWSGSNRDKGQKPKGAGPAWLGTGAAGAGRKSSAQWKSSAASEKDPEARARAARTFFIVAALALLAGFIYLVVTRPEPTPLICFRASAYPLQMPPLAFADEDVGLLSRTSPSNVRVMPVKIDSASSLDDFRKTLQSAGRRFNYFRRGNEVLLVHIAAHGVVNDNDQPCLVPPAADPFDSETWLPLGKVFEAIREETALKGKKKLVLLDCQRVFSCWRCGWLDSRFQDNIAAAVKVANDPELYVFTAADAGQINWPAPELRSSVFSHFLARGLRGEGASGSSVSFLDVCRFVATHSDAYSRQRRDTRQQPILFHADSVYRLNDGGNLVDTGGQPARLEDFSLAYIDRWQSKKSWEEIRSSFDPLADAKALLGLPPVGDKIPSESKESLNRLWQIYRQLRQPQSGEDATLPAFSIDPVAWSSIQQRFSAIGERLFAGREYQGSALQTEIERLAKDLHNKEAWRPRGTLPKLSVLQVARQELASADGVKSTADNLFSLYLKTEAAKREEVLPKRASSPRLVKDIYSALTDGTAPSDARANLRTALELFERYRQPSDPYLVEEHFLRLLDRGVPSNESLTGLQLATALKSRQSAELAGTPTDLRVHYALESMVNTADDKRREAEDIVFLGNEARRSENLWREATADSPGSGYAAAINYENQIAECVQLRDEIWADLPLVAEWSSKNASMSAASTAQQFISVLQGTIDLDDAIERALRSRDEPSTFATRMERCQRIFQTVSSVWGTIRSNLEKVYDLPTNVEQAYRRGEYIREAEAALHIPPLAGSSRQFVERYVQTLEQWASEKSPSAARSENNASGSAAPTSESSTGAAGRGMEFYPVFREIHRALAYEFVDPYDQHRHAQPWDQNLRPDVVFRTPGQESGWRRIRKLLDAYNEAIASQSPSWSATQSAIAAGAKLRQWDRRIRVAGPWLASFKPDLKSPNQPTPARWLQEFDAAHWTAWQAYRAKCDFWGNGQPPGTGISRPYFAEAIDQCEAALPESLRPIRYDIPGGNLADFAERSPAALAALDRWEAIGTPRSSRTSVRNSGEVKIDMAIQPIDAEKNESRLPTGVATLSIQAPAIASAVSAANSITGSFDAEGRDQTRPVPLPLRNKEPTSVVAFLHLPADPQAAAGELDARLWYRGHVRTKPLPLPRPSGSQFVEYEFARPNYTAPTVEVRGNDAVRGAVVFIFDCSSSMRSPDNRFNDAKKDLTTVLRELDRNSGSDLKVGLMAYGRRTPADGQPPIFFRFQALPDDPNNLTDLGRQEATRLSRAFSERHPHPDRDVEVCTPLLTSTAADAAAELAKFKFDDCRGCTPLYYSIQQALDRGFEGLPRSLSGARQIVVVSDGVNMPYDSDQGAIRAIGLRVNNADREALEAALANHVKDTQVSVVLFGQGAQTPTDKAQLDVLQTIAAAHPNFRVYPVPKAADVARTIRNAFPKAVIELSADDAIGASQAMAFNQPLGVPQWPTDGLLRREPVRELVRLKAPGETRTTDKELDLIGGERVVLQYEPRDAQLSFIDDGLTRRGVAVMQPPRASDNRRLLFDALDPERVGLAVNKLNFRLRDDDSPRRFTPRPKYAWLEVRPLLAGGVPSDRTFPCIDVFWKENINLPRLQMPVEHWPECTTARVKALFRYTDPLMLAQATIPRDRDDQVVSAGTDKWQVEQTGGDGGAPRKITVSWEPGNSSSALSDLIERAVWLSPPPDVTRRQYALDGSAAIHEFTYNREGVGNVEVRIVSRSQFEQGAYSAELEFDVAN